MLEPIIAWLKEVWKDLWPLTTLAIYEKGLILRNGKMLKELGAGIHFKIPWVDQVLSTPVVVTTMDLPAQSLTTTDKKTVTVSAVVKYRIKDASKFLLEVMDQKDALSDTSMGVIARLILDSSWDDLRGNSINDQITTKVKREGTKYGIEVIQVTLKDITQSMAIRVFNGGSTEILM